MTYISGNLRYLRKLANLSQQGFAEKVGLNRGNIASYEKGSAEPSLTNLLRIIRYFGVDLLDFIDRDLTQDLSQVGVRRAPEPSLPSGVELDTHTFSAEDFAPNGHESLSLEELYRRSKDLEKIIEGLKRYHQLKIARLDDLNYHGQLLRLDYSRLLEIAEEVMRTNHQLIDMLDAQSVPHTSEEGPTSEQGATFYPSEDHS